MLRVYNLLKAMRMRAFLVWFACVYILFGFLLKKIGCDTFIFVFTSQHTKTPTVWFTFKILTIFNIQIQSKWLMLRDEFVKCTGTLCWMKVCAQTPHHNRQHTVYSHSLSHSIPLRIKSEYILDTSICLLNNEFSKFVLRSQFYFPFLLHSIHLCLQIIWWLFKIKMFYQTSAFVQFVIDVYQEI